MFQLIINLLIYFRSKAGAIKHLKRSSESQHKLINSSGEISINTQRVALRMLRDCQNYSFLTFYNQTRGTSVRHLLKQ